MDSFSDLCTPAQVYVILTAFTLIAMIFGKQYGPAVAKFIFAILFTFFLNWLCSNGLTGVSWFIVLLPFIAIGIALVFFVFATAKMGAVAVANAGQQQMQQQYGMQQQPQQQQQQQQQR
jgi:hypothetical protein